MKPKIKFIPQAKLEHSHINQTTISITIKIQLRIQPTSINIHRLTKHYKASKRDLIPHVELDNRRNNDGQKGTLPVAITDNPNDLVTF